MMLIVNLTVEILGSAVMKNAFDSIAINKRIVTEMWIIQDRCKQMHAQYHEYMLEQKKRWLHILQKKRNSISNA